MTIDLNLTINLWWIINYLAFGVALFFPMVVAFAWLERRQGVGERLRRQPVTYWASRFAVCSVIWPFVLFVVIHEAVGVHQARKRIAEIQRRRLASRA